MWFVVEMNSVLRHTLPVLVNFHLKNKRSTKQFFLLSHHLAIGGSSEPIVSSVCDSLRKGLNWDMLNSRYDSVALDDRIIEIVLLELKEPFEAKKALSFFHWVAHSKKITHGLKAYCLAIHILARARLLTDARGLLQSLLKRNIEIETVSDSSTRLLVVNTLLSTYHMTHSCPTVFELLVQAYSKLGMFETAFDVCRYLDDQGFSVSLGTFNTLVYVIRKSADKSGFIWKVYEHMIQKRIYPNEVTIRIMIDALCKAGELQMFVAIIDRIHGKRCSPSVIVNTSLVYRILREGRIQEGIISLKRMLQKNMILDTISYSLIVFAKLKSGELDSAKEIYGKMLKRGFHPNSFVHTVFIGAYCDYGMVEEALNLMEEMESIGLKPYDDTYNSLITACARTGALDNSIILYEEMTKKGMLPSSTAFNEVVEKLCLAGKMKDVDEMLTTLSDKGFVPNVTLYSHMIDGYRREKNIQEVLKLYYEMEFRSVSPGLPIFSSLIRILCECGKLEEADKYLSVMKSRSIDPTICIYEPLIHGLLAHGNKRRACQLYHEVLQKGLNLSQPIEDLER